ncbi:valine--tRNA ligase [Marinifilum fragile]|uniref:valine--tRNA ligase n=1 Tax=Marinifilum fragile TaxID=570161 RepID=UPI002AA655A4|nr:valine--tRNA ligase [Marinifilum fragile]
MEIPTKYNPAESEDKWYKYWMDKGFFHSVPDEREAYTIVIPPPNVTGVLHMGHMLNNTIQDVLVRRARLQGKNVCWVPGTDHASIATEAKVVNKLKQEGIAKADITRNEFMKHAWEWKEKHGGIILEQLKKLGASCDWERTAFTMDESLYESVIDVFIDLYKKDKIYRGVRMVNWDPAAQTAVSDEEVIYKELQSKLYYLRYKIEGTEDEYVTIATTRPETILGDTAVCVNPNDERFAHLKGKRVIVPLVNRSVPIIQDEYVDMEFGTGALKITPAHDLNDYEIGDRHNLESIDIFNDNGTMSEAAQMYIGKDRFEVRDLIVPDLEAAGNLVKVEDYVNKVGFSERTDAVIEPKLSMQWFLKMKELSAPALEHVMNDDIQLHPAKFKNTYRHWMENVKDWCISRQLWWGQRIPVYYLPEGGYVVAKTVEEAIVEAKAKTGKEYKAEDLRQDEDVLDTWFSSWLWPISVFDGIRKPGNEEIKYYYPTNDLVSGPDILFFWIARMVIAGYEYIGEKPFSNVYLTGIVRDSQRRKMSKSLGNSPDPLDLIAKYGADGVRVGMLLCSPAGGDLLFDENLPEQGRNFTTKIWNAFRLVKGWEVADIEQPESARIATEVFHARLNKTMETLDEQFKQYRISEALMTVYTLFRDEFSSWYLEMVKPAYQQPIDKKTYEATVGLFEKLMQLLHPFMPFLTEEIYQLLADRTEEDSIMISVMPKPEAYEASLLEKFEQVKEVIVAVRNIRKQKNIAFKDELAMNYMVKEGNYDTAFDTVIAKMCNLNEISAANGEMTGAMSFIVKAVEYFIPLGDLVDVEEELKKLEEELKYTQGFLNSVSKKLSNERFVNNAPAQVVEMEKKKQADAEAKIKVLEERIASMK